MQTGDDSLPIGFRGRWLRGGLWKGPGLSEPCKGYESYYYSLTSQGNVEEDDRVGRFRIAVRHAGQICKICRICNLGGVIVW